ncbi:DinB family protein [Aquimarina gracilis]|uniref:DinB family protein n=1 Tax=Aquimarina gracilis TaxID=874422 RepID=A0ABU6A2F2_9FLAO|nr:DinB family protein [Aquimarina gracilis]MEB3348357.1 DinB family protein [Aquimarina gracilis]
MKDLLEKLEKLIVKGRQTIIEMDGEILEYKESEMKWSKKEILGHLIDSAINNLQRFCEVQFIPEPYEIRKYNQNELVKVNLYQELDIETLLTLWISLNQQIVVVTSNIDKKTLDHSIKLDGNVDKTVRWLVVDYIDHMEHHMKQIKE